MKHAGSWIVLFFLIVAPAWPDEADETAAPQAATDAEEEARPPYPEDTFRLYSRLDTGLRLRPNAGLRLLSLEPLYSPRTADYQELERRWGSRSRSAVALSLSLFDVDGERGNYKAQEFRDLSENAALGIDAQFRNDRHRLRLTGRHLGLEDRDVFLQWRWLGVAKTQIHSNRILHNFAFDTASLYSGAGTGRLTLAPGVQEALQASGSEIAGAALLEDFVANAARSDIGLVRDRLGLTFELTAFDPLAVKITVDDESRTGARPWSGSFGFFNFVEIPWAVDYDQENLRVELEWAKPEKAALVRGSYYQSSFDNHIDSQIFDNPWRATDTGIPSFMFGAATGELDLYPNNEQDEVTLTAVKGKLPWRGTVQATVSWGTLEQNDPLLPYTTNTAVVPGARFGNPPFDASDPANRPADSANAELETQLVHLRWTARPSDLVSLEAHYRDYELDNRTAQIFIPGAALEDLIWRPYPGTGAGYTNLPIAYQKTSYGFDVGFHLDLGPKVRGTKLTFSYDNENIDRDFREVEESDEDRFEVKFDIKPATWADLRASYLYSERDADEYDFAQFFRNQDIDALPILPFLRKFDQADRDRDRLQVMANFYPSESLIVGAHVIVGSDDYPESQFGVLGDEHAVYAADLSYTVDERLSFFVSYSVEEYEVALRGREWFPGAVSDPFLFETGFDSASNWTAETEDEIETVAVGVDVELIPNRLRLDLAYTWSRSDGEIVYASPIGTADLNPFDPADFPEVDDVTHSSFHPELELTVNERFALVLAYLRESYEILDFNLDGFQLVPTTTTGQFNGGLLIGALPGDYDVDVLALKLEVDF